MDSMLMQESRKARLKTPLGDNALVITRFDGHEGISELFEYRIEAHSKDEVNYDAILGRPCTVTLEEHGKQRHFNGVAVEAQWLGMLHELHTHRIVLRPWLWLCSRTSDCRFFLEKNAPDIIEEVFRDRRFDAYQLSLSENHPKREYCVQYRETDFAFVSRLMEHEGIFYYFEHTADKHTLVLADSMSTLKPVPEFGTIPYIAAGNVERRDRQHIYNVVSQRRFRTGKVELNEYNELQPNSDQKANKSGTARYERSQMEFYDYPGKYKQRSEGEHYAKVVLEAEQALDGRRHTSGNAVCLFPGGLTTLKDHPKQSENINYLVVRASHQYVAEHYRSGIGLQEEEEYLGQFEFLPNTDNKVFRAPIVTPKPLIHGIQTARVVGAKGEEIDVDEHGRIKVEFFWDRKKKQSCRIRVAEMWAGKKWGWQFIPRIGMEVVVEFLEGDPDRPLVVGSVYNGEYKHPYDMPGDKTQSGVKSDSTKGGNGYNELRFEDKKSAEKITVHAQKDYDLTILDTETREIGQQFTGKTAGPNSRKTTLLQGDDDLTIASGNQSVRIAMNRTSTVGMSENNTIGMSQTNMIGVSQTNTIGVSQTTMVGTTVTIIANTGITLVSGGSTVIIDPSGVKIIAPTFTVLAPGGAVIKGATAPLAS